MDKSSPTYVVRVERRILGAEPSMEFLQALKYDPYQAGGARTHLTSPDLEDAFKFRTLAAAEMAAVAVAGCVEELP